MSVQSLLLINPDKLFEENGIDRIKTIEIQIQNEIEKKREELRTMVGERYRDLLKAADTITEMRQTADSVIRCINRTETLCKTFLDKRLSNVKKAEKTLSTSEGIGDISKIIQIKILLSLPEQIWMTVDNKNYLFGAELFLFANHIHFDIDVSPNAAVIKEEYPVLSKQWEVIISYRNIIISGAHHHLKLIDLPYQVRDLLVVSSKPTKWLQNLLAMEMLSEMVYCVILLNKQKAGEYLACGALLDVINYEHLIDQYLSLRMTKLQEILQSDDVTRNKLKLIILLIQYTLSTVYKCFWGNAENKCFIDHILEKIVGNDAKPTHAKVPQATSLPDHYISPVVRDFHPKIKKELTCLQEDSIKSRIQAWLQQVEKLLKVELMKLLLLINDIRRLDKIIKEEAMNVEYPNDWKIIVSAMLDIENLNIYDHFMKDIVTKRVVEIIGNIWENCISSVFSTLRDIDEEISKERVKMLENDIRWFVWKENIMDSRECLRLKTQGYTSRVMKLCHCLENSIKQLLEDVELYVGESFSDPKLDIRSYGVQILLFLNRCSSDMLRRLSGKVIESCKPGGVMVSESGIIVRARFLQSLITQSPSLERCLRQGQRQALKELPGNDLINAWPESCALLSEESTKIWMLWTEAMSTKLGNLVRTKLPLKISLRTLLESKPLNEVISIEEQTEDGTNVQSDIRIPSQPSLPLQDLLFQACQLLNAVVPHTLPRKIHLDLVDSFVLKILERYEEWSRSETIYQSQAWQMLFDVRLIALLLITQENKILSQSVCETLEKIIDPFDLDVHYPHLQNSVKRSTQRLQGTVGVLINFREKLPVFNGLKLTQNISSTRVEEPNVLAMSAKIPWFPLLAVPNQSGGASVSKESTPEKIVKAKEKENRRESKSRDFVKSANAFLNAVTSRWS